MAQRNPSRASVSALPPKWRNLARLSQSACGTMELVRCGAVARNNQQQDVTPLSSDSTASSEHAALEVVNRACHGSSPEGQGNGTCPVCGKPKFRYPSATTGA